MNPLVSIGISFHNNADMLGDAIRSVFAQTLQSWELILVDDHSSDCSLFIAQSVIDPRVRVYNGGAEKGFVFQLNRITQMIRGKYYARMDADDMMHPERISKQISYLEGNRNIDLVDTAIYSMDQQCNVKAIRNLNSLNCRPAILLGRGLLCHATVTGYGEWFKKNPYDPKYMRAEDRELWCRTFKNSHFGRVKEPLYFVREGLVNVNNYLVSGRTERVIMKTYGHLHMGKYRVMQLIAKSYIKGYAYRLFSLVNSHDVLVNLRNQTLSKKEKAFATSTIEQIRATHVPGLTES
ncbi:MAG: glycosyltransferase family 2 protein [Syntrophales bacterium]